MTTELSGRMIRKDALPSDIRFNATCGHYSKCGCEVTGCCFDCPLPVCKYELPHGLNTLRAQQRALRIAHFTGEGFSVDWIARVMGLSRRTVFRVLAGDKRRLTDTTRRATLSLTASAVPSVRRDNGRR